MDKIKRYNRIKAVLADSGKSNKDIAEHFKIQEETVSRWMSNKAQPSLQRLFEIAEFLDVDVRILIVSNKT
ncbi:helix-turn-helix domain-containing protein [Shivajiella indica]|uniref:Helix-turn-helix domain-containing protein n=1 Tax=Shivajiella indica TaxID=872115 RepID=A0ABW5BF47_9BACT